MCKCGCGTCETKITGPLLTESKVKSLLSEGLNHHISNAIPLHETIYRYGSVKHLALIKEARKLYSRNIINLNEYDTELIKTNLGEWGVYEGEAVPLDLPRMNEDRDTPMIMKLLQIKNELRKKGFKVKVGKPSKFDNRIQVQHMGGDLDDLVTTLDGMLGKEGYRIVFDTNQLMLEAEFRGKNVKLNSPKRGGSKAYYVYVKNPKTGRVKKVSFGSGGLRAKINNPKARKAFSARHNCPNKKDRTKAGYWSCNLPRYAKQLGLGANKNTFW